MISVNNLSLFFGATKMFSDVNIVFNEGNCYGIIGANGAGKSTFLKILSGELDASSGEVNIPANLRMSQLVQDQNKYDAYTVMDTVIMGNKKLYDVREKKDALYAKEDFSEEDGILASELEYQFAEMGGWDAESDAAKILNGLDIDSSKHDTKMADLDGREKVKVLLVQALFGKPDIILLDEPTNNLDYKSIRWLEDFLMDFPGTIIIVSHDRHFLNTVCTHIVDIDYTKIQIYVGNYDFWYESSRLVQRLLRDQQNKAEEKAKELKEFIARFSANKSKARQATSRKKLLDNLDIAELPASSRRHPWVGFKADRELGKDILQVTELSKTVDGVQVLDKVSFTVNRDDKIAFVGENEIAITTLFKILTGELQPDSGTFKWGVSTSQSYFPKDNTQYFKDNKSTMLAWLSEFASSLHELDLRQFLGRMLFSGDDVLKSVNVLSGGERVRLMLSRMMLSGSNVLIFDQPTNHLDLESITALNNGIIDFKGCVLFSSHDHEFTQTIANRIIEFTPTQMIDRMMTFEEYLEFKG